jgi:glycerophosphoryl diester phosphodiesterase
MHPPILDHLENTIASVRAGFELGADVVEFDVHPTTDGTFAVFHDWTLDCRTDGRARRERIPWPNSRSSILVTATRPITANRFHSVDGALH